MNAFWTEHGTKILGALTAVLGTLASLITAGAFEKLLSETAVGWMSIFVSLATAGVGGATMARGFNNSAQVKIAQAMETAIKSTPPQQAGFARVGFLVMLIIAALVGLSGCATNPVTGKQELTQTGKVALQEIAAIAIARGVRSSPRAAEISARIRKVAVELQGMTDEVTVAELKERLQKRIDKLDDPYDRSDLTRVLNIASALITDYVGQGKLDSAAMVRVNEYVGYLVAALPA